MTRLVLPCMIIATLAGCGAAPQGNVRFSPSPDTIAIDDAAGRAASQATTGTLAERRCAAMGKEAYYVESQANLATSANEHLYLCW